MIAIKQNAFMAYTGGCVLEDVEINSTSSTPLIIEEDAVFYEKDSAVTITVNAAKLATVTSCPVGNYSSPVNLIYNVQEPITFNRRVLSSFDNSTVTIYKPNIINWHNMVMIGVSGTCIPTLWKAQIM